MMSNLIKLLLVVEILLIIVHPLQFKKITGYSGLYFNPQFLFLFLIAPLLLYTRALEPSKLVKYKQIILLILLMWFLYFFSSMLALIFTDVNPAFPLSESIVTMFNYIILLSFASLKEDYAVFILKCLVILGFFEFLFVYYGILGFLGVVPLSETLRSVVFEDIMRQSWTAVGFIPKWGGTFMETQMLSTLYFLCYMSVDLISLYKEEYNKSKFYKLLKFLFAFGIVYNMSKSTLPVLILYIMITKFWKKLKLFLVPFAFLIVSVVIFSLSREEIIEIIKNPKNIEELALNYSSFGERIFHIMKTFEFMSDNLLQFFFGLGPRVYGTLISKEYPDVFGEYSNAISAFNIFQNIGLIGFLTFMLLLLAIYSKLRTRLGKISFLVLLLAIMPQVAWAPTFIYFFIGLLMNYDNYLNLKGGRNR